ncbi:MAG: hypothetical protein ABI616_00730 [Pseudomonadota bacterium]
MGKSLVASSSRIPLLLVLCGLAMSGAAAVAAGVSKEGGPPPPAESAVQLDEIAVNGKRWRELKRELIEAEDRFYKRFNKLNTNDDFDIHCRMDTPTGTLIPKRQCRIQFLANAEAINAREFLMGLTSGTGPTVHTPVAALMPQWVERREEYRQTPRALLEKDPELMALATNWVRLQEQYDRAAR